MTELDLHAYNIGVTASQQGINQKQWRIAQKLIAGAKTLHHGDCIGGDYDLHVVTRQFSPKTRIVIHPPEDSKKRAWCWGDDLLPVDGYRERNMAIVESSDLLLAFSSSMVEVMRSGTWMTVRIARKMRKSGLDIKTIIVYPNGSFGVDTE